MFNLLPDNLKRKVKSEYRLRLSSVVLVFTLFVQVSFLFFIFPAWLGSSYKEKEAITQKDLLDKSLLILDTKTVSSAITTLNMKLNVINSVLQYPKVLPLVNSLLAKITGQIYINGLTFESTSAKTGTVAIRGISSNREALVVFVKKIQDSGLFKSVDLPISNFTKDKNIDFSVSMTIAP